MQVLLTGGTGFIGSHTYVEMIKAGNEVVIADNFYNSNIKVIERLEEITGKKPKFYNADICNKTALREVFEENNIEAVIHFAGYKAVGESVHKPLFYYRNNLDSTITLCEVMKEFDVKKFVFSSSATVYGTNSTMPLVETMATGCTSPYGWTKYMIEQILQDICTANPDWSVSLLRYFNPVGAHPSGLIGEAPCGIPNNLMPYVTQVACGKLKELSVFGHDYPTRDGTGLRDYIHVVDLAKAHVAACKYTDRNNGCEIFNIGTGNGFTVLELIETFKKVNNVDVPYKLVDRREGDVAECYANCAKANKLLNWKTELGIEDICRDSWNWQSKNPNGYN